MGTLVNESPLKLDAPPIVEAVVDIECDMPPGQVIDSLEGQARERFRAGYPKIQKVFLQEHKVDLKSGQQPSVSISKAVRTLQFMHNDEKQIVQLRTEGYSFNRLAPYRTLDDYLPEVESTWASFRELAGPVQIKFVRLRYINRIMIPIAKEGVELDDYFKVGPRLPDGAGLTFVGFLNQHRAREPETGHLVNIVLTDQPREGNYLPVIFDNAVTAPGPREPEDWPWIIDKIRLLRTLKNHVFRETLTARCLNLFHQA